MWDTKYDTQNVTHIMWHTKCDAQNVTHKIWHTKVIHIMWHTKCGDTDETDRYRWFMNKNTSKEITDKPIPSYDVKIEHRLKTIPAQDFVDKK